MNEGPRHDILIALERLQNVAVKALLCMTFAGEAKRKAGIGPKKTNSKENARKYV